MGTSHRIRNMAFGPPSIGKPKSTPHGPRPSLQDSDEAQLRACLGLPARAWAVLGDIGSGRRATHVVPNAKHGLKIAIIVRFKITIIQIYNCNLRLKFEKLPQPKHGSTHALINATRVFLFLKVIEFLLFSHNFIP